MQNIQALAIEEALKNCDNRHRVGALICRGGAIIAKACNYRDRHAEIRAINKVWASELKGATIFVARPCYIPGKLGMSRPCEKCEIKLRSVGISKIVYTDWEGNWVWERI